MVHQPARLVDVAPTILKVVRPRAPLRGLDGVDLFAFLDDATPPDAERPIWLQRPYYPDGEAAEDRAGPCFGVRQGKWKYIEAPEQDLRLLFDLAADPAERTNLAGAEPARVAELAALLRAWRDAEAGKVLAGDLSTSEEDERAMRALGYGGDE